MPRKIVERLVGRGDWVTEAKAAAAHYSYQPTPEDQVQFGYLHSDD